MEGSPPVISTEEKMERRFRLGGLLLILVGALAAVYALRLVAGGPEPPTYGLALSYLLDQAGRTLDRIGGWIGDGWQQKAFQANLALSAVLAGLGLLAWLGSRIGWLFAALRLVPRLGSRLVYLAAMALYALDTLVGLGLEVGARRLFHVEGFALVCLAVHLAVLMLLAMGLATGVYGILTGFAELFRFLTSPLRALREARKKDTGSPD